MAEIRAEGVSLGAVGQRLEPRLPGTVRANKGLKRRRKGTLFCSIKADSGRRGQR